MGGKASRTKGHSFERQIAADMRTIYPGAKRGFQTRGGTEEECDVEGTPYFIECKVGKNPPLRPALNQAIKAQAANGDERIPVAICKRDRTDTLVVMRYEDWLMMVEAVEGKFYLAAPDWNPPTTADMAQQTRDPYDESVLGANVLQGPWLPPGHADD